MLTIHRTFLTSLDLRINGRPPKEGGNSIIFSLSYACISDKGEVEDTNDDDQNVGHCDDVIDKEKEEIAALEKMFANRFTDQDKSFVQVF